MKTMKIILVIASIALVSAYASPTYIIRGDLETSATTKKGDTTSKEPQPTTHEDGTTKQRNLVIDGT